MIPHRDYSSSSGLPRKTVPVSMRVSGYVFADGDARRGEAPTEVAIGARREHSAAVSRSIVIVPPVSFPTTRLFLDSPRLAHRPLAGHTPGYCAAVGDYHPPAIHNTMRLAA